MGKRYDGHPSLKAVDLSIAAAWGEGAGSELLMEMTRGLPVKCYADNLRKTPLIAFLTDKKPMNMQIRTLLPLGVLIASAISVPLQKTKMDGNTYTTAILSLLLNLA